MVESAWSRSIDCTELAVLVKRKCQFKRNPISDWNFTDGSSSLQSIVLRSRYPVGPIDGASEASTLVAIQLTWVTFFSPASIGTFELALLSGTALSCAFCIYLSVLLLRCAPVLFFPSRTREVVFTLQPSCFVYLQINL